MFGIPWLDIILELTGIVWWLSAVSFISLVMLSFKIKDKE